MKLLVPILLLALPCALLADSFDPTNRVPQWTNSGAVDYAPVAISSAGAAVTKTISAAGAGKRIVLEGVAWSFSDTPAAGTTLTISDGATVMEKWYITAAGPSGAVKFPRPLLGSANTALTATLSAPGGSVVGTISVCVRVE